jgi:Mg2+ and Co2+ transporter CorA
MTVGDQKFSSSLTVLKDPNSEGSLADIQAQTEWLAKIQADYDQGGKMVNEVESIRRQLYDLRDVLGSKGSSMKKLVESVSKLDSTLTLVEGKLVQLKYTGTGQDDVRYPDMLLGKFGYLAGAIATADFPPADQHKAVYAELKKRLTDIQAEFDRVLKTDVAALLQLLNENKIQPIVTGMK